MKMLPLEQEIHVVTHVGTITSFVDTRNDVICFRCGQRGHVRNQCLTFKVRPCWRYEHGICQDPHCTYAHGEGELRHPWRSRCVRVVKNDGKFMCIGCDSEEHTFRKCPLHTDLLLL